MFGMLFYGFVGTALLIEGIAIGMLALRRLGGLGVLIIALFSIGVGVSWWIAFASDDLFRFEIEAGIALGVPNRFMMPAAGVATFIYLLLAPLIGCAFAFFGLQAWRRMRHVESNSTGRSQ